jgi:hypothetical protein
MGFCDRRHVGLEIRPTASPPRGTRAGATTGTSRPRQAAARQRLKIDIPVPVAAAFEGETVRRDDMQVQFGGKYTTAFEYLRMREMDEVQDGKIELIGSDCDAVDLGGAMPLGMLIEVAGRKMQTDFEPILERQVHTIVNHAMGVFHMGQRNLTWVRISKDAFKAGLRLKHFGELLRRVPPEVPRPGGQGAGDRLHRRAGDGAPPRGGASHLGCPRRTRRRHDR